MKERASGDDKRGGKGKKVQTMEGKGGGKSVVPFCPLPFYPKLSCFVATFWFLDH